MNRKTAEHYLLALQLLEKLREICIRDKNYFATGAMTGTKGQPLWIAWALLKPNCEPMIYNGRPENGNTLSALSIGALKDLLSLQWTSPEPLNALEVIAREAGGNIGGIFDEGPVHSGLPQGELGNSGLPLGDGVRLITSQRPGFDAQKGIVARSEHTGETAGGSHVR